MSTLPCFRPISQLRDQLRSGDVTSVSLVKDTISRISRLGALTNSIVVQPDPNVILAEAAEADEILRRENAAGPDKPKPKPLLGLPMTVKLHIDVAGMVTCDGVSCHEAEHDAPVVQALKNAGAIIVGKTNVPATCSDYQTYNPHYGLTKNPHDLDLTPGGSSGGSAAAVAACLTVACIGTDIGGSVRVPASFCGVFAHKPTWGLISKAQGVGSSPPSDMSTTGPIARSAEDLKIIFGVLADQEGQGREEFAGLRNAALMDASLSSLEGCRVAVWRDDNACPVDKEVTEALELTISMLRECGAIVVDRKPDIFSEELFSCYRKAVAAGKGAASLSSAAGAGEKGGKSSADDEIGWMNMSHSEWLLNEKTRCEIRHQFSALFDSHDVILSPTFPCGAFPHAFDDANQPFWRESSRKLRIEREDNTVIDLPFHRGCFWPAIANLTLLPATSFPVGSGVGLQVVGAELADWTTLSFVSLLSEAPKGEKYSKICRVKIPDSHCD